MNKSFVTKTNLNQNHYETNYYLINYLRCKITTFLAN